MKRILRGFARAPGFTAVIVFTLAVGIGATTAIFSVVRGVLLRPLPYHEPDRLVSLGNRTVQHSGGELSVPEYNDVATQAQHIETLAAYANGDANLTGAGSPQRVEVGYVTPRFFQLLGVTPVAGRAFVDGEEEPGRDHVAVLGHDLWQTRFGGDPAIVGKDVRLDNEPFRVVGVLPASYAFEQDFALYVPLGFPPETREEKARDQHWLHPLARLKPGISLAELNGELAVIGTRQRADHPTVYTQESGWRPEARPLLDNLVADVRPSLWLLGVAVALVLLIACANVAGLLLARGSSRSRELSVRAALGASRRRLVAQLLGESLVLSALGGALGVLLAVWGTDLLLSLAPDGLPRADQIRVDLAVLGFSVLVTAVSGAIFGLIPAWSASRVELGEALRAGGRSVSAGKQPRRVRRALVVVETALALVLVAGAALIVRSFERVVSVDPGFRAEGVLAVKVTLPPSPDDERRAHVWFTEAEARLRTIPGVTSAGTIDMLPFGGVYSNRLLEVEGHVVAAGAERPSAQFRRVGPGYHETMGIPILAGRTITRADAAGGLPAAVVSEGFAREMWPDQSPIGKRLRLYSPQGPWMTVVGIVGDIKDTGLAAETRTTVYAAAAQSPGVGTRSFVLRSAAPLPPLAAAVRAELERFDPNQPIYDLRPMTERLAESVAQRRFVLVLFELFAAVALGLAALGLYGVLAHTVADRQREIGVRVVLGASRSNILGLVAREGAALVGIGVAVGIAAGLAGARLVDHLLYGVSPTDPLALTVAIGMLVVAGAVATYVPARRALRVEPMEALREE